MITDQQRVRPLIHQKDHNAMPDSTTQAAPRSTYYVPIERRELPAHDVNRWLILPVETSSPVEAIRDASRIARSVLRLRGATVWAAVRDIPSFTYMQSLRDEMDAHSTRRRAAHKASRQKHADSAASFIREAFA